MNTFSHSSSLRYVTISNAFFVSAVFFVSALFCTPALACDLYSSSNLVPPDFGAAYDMFAPGQETVLNTIDCTNTGFSTHIGNTRKNSSNFAVYKNGYVWNGTTWSQVSYIPDGGTVNGSYIMGKAKLAQRSEYYGPNTFYVAFTCSMVDGVWKCGCRDKTCSKNYWQVQAARQPDPNSVAGGGNAGTGGYISGSGAPLRVSTDRHSLLNRSGQPFLWAGDTQWVLNSHSDSDVLRILDNRKQKGFSVIQILATRNWVANHPLGASGDFSHDVNNVWPFHDNNINTPNDTYFDRLIWIADQAASRGLLISYHVGEPARGEQPWPAHDKQSAYNYGYYLGEKFKNKQNIIWNIGHDMVGNGGMGVDAWRAIAEGIADGTNSAGKSYNGNADYASTFMTFHPAGGTKSSWHFHSDEWLDANAFQCWAAPGDIWPFAYDDWNLSPKKPTINVEASYESGPEYGIDINPLVVRQQAYHAYFGGAAGHTYGHNCNWHECIDLDTAGAQGVSLLFSWLRAHSWNTFVPDQSILVSGDSYTDRKTAVRAKNDRALYVYFPSHSGAQLNLSKLSVAQVTAKWFNPASGEVVNGDTYSTNEQPMLTPPNGWEDSVLMLE